MAVTPEAGADLATERSDGLVPFRCDLLSVGDHAVVVVRGDIDVATAPSLHRELRATVALPITGLIVDLAYVTFVDSFGINALVNARRAAVERNIDFHLESVSRQVRTVLETSDLLDMFGLSARSDASIPPADAPPVPLADTRRRL